MDVDIFKYCISPSNKIKNGWCCDDVIDFLDPNCSGNKNYCSDLVLSNSTFYKYLMCPYNNEKCTQGPNITVSNIYP